MSLVKSDWSPTDGVRLANNNRTGYFPFASAMHGLDPARSRRRATSTAPSAHAMCSAVWCSLGSVLGGGKDAWTGTFAKESIRAPTRHLPTCVAALYVGT
eukprot:gene925-biopygen9184